MVRVATALLLLSTVIVQTQELENVARDKPAEQSSDYRSIYPASKAVNGIINNSNDFSHTAVEENPWWKVDLQCKYSISKIELYNRESYYDNLKKISIHTSNVSADGFSTGSSNWTFRNYDEGPYGAIGTIDFDPPVQARHVAVFCGFGAGLTLEEVMVYALPAPDTPTADSTQCVKANHSSREMWKCTLHWQGVNQIVCSVPVSYVLGGDIVDDTPSLYKDFYIDGDQEYHVKLRAKSSEGVFSDFATFSGKTDELAPQFGSSPFTVTGLNATCVKLDWQPPEFPGGHIQTYRYECENKTWQSTNSLTGQQCGYQLATRIKCYLEARNTLTSNRKVAYGNTSCAVPSKPREISSDLREVNQSSRIMWKYTFSWKAPESLNCYGDIEYKYEAYGDQRSPASTSLTTAEIYLDGGKSYRFVVSAKNVVGISSGVCSNGTTGELVPQFGNIKLTLRAHTANCVRLIWQTPTYRGGRLTHYLVKCQAGDWTQTMTNRTDAYRCGYQPYTDVRCFLLAANNRGNSSQLTNTTKTSCAVPQFTSNINHTEAYDSNMKRRVITVYVSVEAITINCESLRPLQYKVLDRELSTNNIIRNLNATTEYKVIVKATNNMNLSAIEYVTVTTGELAPGTGPVITNQQSKEKNCVTVSWNKPAQPNGIIVTYQYKCKEANSSYPIWTNTTSQFLSTCGYTAGDIVTCEIQAANSIGFGPSTEIMVEVTCDNPSVPVYSLNSFLTPNQTAAISLVLQESISHCQSIKHYTVTITPEGGKIVHQQTVNRPGKLNVADLDGFTRYTVVVEVVNNENLSSSLSKTITTVETVRPEILATINLQPDETCVKVHITPPFKANGEIVSYMFSCVTKIGENTKVMDAGAVKISAVLCGFKLFDEVNCSAAAINSVGIGAFIWSTITLKPVEAASQCPSPPTVDGALFKSVKNLSIGETVLYACENGQAKIKGDLQLTCQLGDDGPFWSGSQLVCSKGIWEGFGTVVGCFCLVLIFLFACFILKQRKLRAKLSANQAEGNNPHTYEDVSAGLQPTYADMNNINTTEVETGFNDEYEFVDQPQKVAAAYETLRVGDCEIDHVYEAAQP